MDCLSRADVAISDELVSFITQVMNLFLDGKCPNGLGEYIASAPPIPLVKPGGGIHPIVVGTVWRCLVSKACGDDVGLSMLLVDFKNSFNLVDREVMLCEVHLRFPAISRWVEFCYSNPTRLYCREHTLWSCQGVQQGDPFGPLLFSLVLHPLICKIRDSFSIYLHAWYLDDGTIVGDTMVVGKVLELIMKDGPRCGQLLNVDKTEVFWSKEDPRSRLAGYTFTMRTCPPRVFESAQRSFNMALRFSLERIITASGLGFESTFSLSHRQMALWTSQRDDHTSDWLMTVPISGLGQTMNACSRVFVGDIYGDHAVSCAGIIGIKHRHNVVRDTLVNICYRSGISAGKEVDIGLDGGRDKPLRPTDMLLYSWDGGLDVCVDLTGSSPLTQTGMVDFVPDRAVFDAAQHAVTLLKQIRKFSMAQDIGARAVVHIFNRINFAIAKGVRTR
ncbi:putative reverse transcriptase domain-containing protein [Tanacetum coccineum]